MSDPRTLDEPSVLTTFTRAAERAADQVITSYSTSFGAATRLLGRRHRQHVRNIYALVRVADELVDGVAAEAGLTSDEQAQGLERLQDETRRAMACGYSSDLVVHAFARTARCAGIGVDLVEPFFSSMRTDLAGERTMARFDGVAHDAYVYGSAEVVGLMCLRVFIRDSVHTAAEWDRLEQGARQLGAAFQDVNFLRDLSDDTFRLRRSYLGVTDRLSTADRDAYVARIRRQLREAEDAVALLPIDARAAVRSAAWLFAELANRVAAAEVADLYRRRVRVPDPVKAAIILRALACTWRERLQ